MRRRYRPLVVEPPGRLVGFDAADWLGQVDPRDYDPDRYRDRDNGQPVGEVKRTVAQWRLEEARSRWLDARLAWQRQHGWPGGLTAVDLIQQSVRARPRRVQRP